MGNEEVDLVTVSKPHEKVSLLRKYDIPVEHLSYEYVTRSSSVKELEHIVLILRSGEEGIFPELINHAEKCLEVLSPKSKILRVEEPVVTRAMLEPEDRKIIDEDIAKWMSEMQGREKDLEDGKALSLTLPIQQPEIRQGPEMGTKRFSSESRTKITKQKSIASCDYSSWDKFDADAELDRIDLRDEKNRVDVKNAQKINREKLEGAKKLSRESVVNKLSLTATELAVLAEQERNIGNEAYRAGDYEEALIRYNSSIAINSSTNAYNNRAITNIKLERYKNSVDDCNAVLAIEYDNVIALMRRGLALENLGKKSEALVDYETILKLEPNNKIAIAAVNKLRKPSESKKVRMKIEELKFDDPNDKSETRNSIPREGGDGYSCEYKNDFRKSVVSEICFCDRAPGFSRSPKPPPHYKSSYCLSLNGEDRERPNILGHSKSQSSYFSDVKMNGDNIEKKVGLIIEELPNREENSKFDTTRRKGAVKSSEQLKPEVKEAGNFDSEVKPEVRVSKEQKKINVAVKYENSTVPKACSGEKTNFDRVESPYEFLHTWESLKNDTDLSFRAKLLRSLSPEDLDAVIGNKLDGNMFSIILRCLESNFCNVQDVDFANRFMISIANLSRFTIVRLFMDVNDKEVLKKILNFINDNISNQAAAVLRKAYNV